MHRAAGGKQRSRATVRPPWGTLLGAERSEDPAHCWQKGRAVPFEEATRAALRETGLHLGGRSPGLNPPTKEREDPAATSPRRPESVPCREEGTGAIASKPTLRQAWQRWKPMPQYAFKISMFNVSCNSH